MGSSGDRWQGEKDSREKEGSDPDTKGCIHLFCAKRKEGSVGETLECLSKCFVGFKESSVVYLVMYFMFSFAVKLKMRS